MIYVYCGLLASILALPYRGAARWSSTKVGASTPGANGIARDGYRTAERCLFFLSFALLSFVAATRYGVGTDYLMRYVPTFYDIRAGRDPDVDIEPGYILVNRVVAYFTGDYQWVFAIMSAATIGLIYRFIARNSLNPALSILLFVLGGFYLEPFNLVRQGLAIALVLNTIEFVADRRLRPFLLVTALASTFHFSALAWLLVWPLCNLRLGRSGVAVKTGLLLVLVFVAPGVLQQAVSQWAPTYERYFESDYGVVQTFDPWGFLLALLLFGLTLIAMAGQRTISRLEHVVSTIQGIQIASLVAGTVLAYAYSRLTYYLTPIQLLVVPILLSRVKSPVLRFALGVIVVTVYFAVFVHKFLVWNAHEVLPYQSVFDE